MELWFLVVFAWRSGAVVLPDKYESIESCQLAAAAFSGRTITAVCVPAGTHKE